MLFAPQPSPLDFFFYIGPVPVCVSWTHWLGGILLGWQTMYPNGPAGGAEPAFLAVWLIVFFVSILVHELGHAFMARFFGYSSDVTLVFFGGFARYDTPRSLSYGREVLITLAGPAAGFALCAFSAVLLPVAGPFLSQIGNEKIGLLLAFAIQTSILVNLFWSILNMMPVLPLDGGRVTDVACRAWSPASGAVVSRWIGVVVGGVVAAAAFAMFRLGFVGLMFLMFAYWNYQDLQQNRR